MPVRKNLLPLKDADLLAQAGWPEWVAVHKIIDGAMALSFDQPQPVGTSAVGSLTERSGSANLMSVLLKEGEMGRHQALARLYAIGVVREQRNIEHP